MKKSHLAPLISLVSFAVAILVSIPDSAVAQFHKGQCPRGGRQCNGCLLVEDCTDQGGLFTIRSTPVETCHGDQACDASKDVARCEAGATCRYKQFTCPPDLQEGEEVFPDPYSCVEYHVCKDGEPKDYTCGSNEIFDLREKRCVARGDDGCSGTPVPLCDEAGTVWSISGTDYEYVCVEEAGLYRVIYPQVRLNAGRELRDNEDADNSTTTSSSVSTTPEGNSTTTSEGAANETVSTTEPSSGTNATSPETGETSSTTTTIASTTPATSSICTDGAGVYPVQTDCRKYYICYLLPDGTLTYAEKMCRSGSHFDSTANRCVAGSCTKFPTTTAQTGTTQTTVTPVDCQSDGPKADKECCRCYYVCYNTGGSVNYARKCCRSGSHFDAQKGRCVAGNKCSPTNKCP